jgi:hypothetical protein
MNPRTTTGRSGRHPVPALPAFEGVLASVEAMRNGRALFLMLLTFAAAGLLLAMAETALVNDRGLVAVAEAGAALFVAFYGGNAAGLVLMDQARGLPLRDAADAVRDALLTAHRLLIVLAAALGVVLAVGGVLWLLLWAARADVLGARLGAALFGLTVPVAVVVVGTVMLAMSTVVAPLAAPAVWAGLGVGATLRLLAAQVRQRLLFVAVLMAAVTLLTAAVGGVVAAAVVGGGRVVALMAVFVTDIDLPPQQLMAGLFGYGLRSLGATGAPVAHSSYGAAALVGGGVVFALALVLPALVYLRGLCAVLLALMDGTA